MRLLWISLVCLSLATTAHAESAPADTINTLHAALLQNMKDSKTLTCTNRIATIKKVVNASFDLPFLAKHIVRKYWAAQAAPQQQDFSFALEEMIASTYASQFSSFNGEKFVTQKTEDLGKDRKVVHAQLIIPNDDPVTFDYVLKNIDGKWRIINVIAEGVSDLAIRSAQYDRVIKDKGFNGLLTQIKSQNDKIKTDCQLALAR